MTNEIVLESTIVDPDVAVSLDPNIAQAIKVTEKEINAEVSSGEIIQTVLNIGPPGPAGEAGEGIQIDATGTLAERSAYDGEADNFAFYATDTELLYVLHSSVWSAGIPIKGIDGATGESAYEASGFAGTEQEWLDSLIGADGADGDSAYTVAVNSGFSGTEQEWLDSLVGTDGDSAYTIAVADGFSGTEQEWLASLQGSSFTIDVSDLLANKSNYDSEAAGFTLLATDTGDVYIRDTATAGVWIGPFQFTGDKGDPGEQGPGLEINASGLLSGRDAYDNELDNFSYFATDTELLYFRDGATPGVWTTGVPIKGDDGPTGPTGPAGTYDGPAIYAQSTEPAGAPDGSIWIEIT